MLTHAEEEAKEMETEARERMLTYADERILMYANVCRGRSEGDGEGGARAYADLC